jgi:hypothetical protein
MRGRFFTVLALIGLTLPAAAAPRSLDALFKGFDNACDYSEALDTLLQSSYAFARKEGSLSVPAGYEGVFGPPRVKPDRDYLEITLPVVDGTWRGVPVKEIEVYITKLESGFASHAVIFQPDALKAAQTAFKARGIAAKKKLTKMDVSDFGWDTGFAIVDGWPRYQCDLST